MTRLTSSPLPWLVGLVATVLAAFVMFYYVNLLQEAVARGSQFKYTQQEPRTASAKPAVRNLVGQANY